MQVHFKEEEYPGRQFIRGWIKVGPWYIFAAKAVGLKSATSSRYSTVATNIINARSAHITPSPDPVVLFLFSASR
jgi:hypothetical protein